MKILRITSSIDPQYGGVVQSILQMERAARAFGHQVEVLCIDDPDAEHINKLDFVVHAVGRGVLNYRFQPRLLGWLYRHASDYDTIIVDGIWQFHSVAAHWVLRYLGLPYFIYTHGMLAPWFKVTHPIKHFKKWLYWVVGEYWVLRDAQAVLFTCEEERMGARQSFGLYRAVEKVVRLGVQSPTVDLDVARAGFLQDFPDLNGKKTILFLGRLHPIKGIDLLIRAFAQTFSGNDNYRLVIAGPGDVSYVKTLQNLALSLHVADQVCWTGMLNEQKKWGAIAAADIFALFSHHENFGMVIAEALACGKPVLISDKVNIWREIAEDNAGWADSDSVEGAARLFDRYCQMSNDELQRMSHNAQVCFAKKFEITCAVQTLLETIKKR